MRPTEANLTKENLTKFHSLVQHGKPNQCWPWRGSIAPDKYGRIHVGGYFGRAIRAHRIAYFLAYGELSDNDVVRHTCDNPRCCNPNHLLRGTQQENLQDMRDKGRARYGICCGTANGSAKIDAVTVARIRRAVGTVRDIAKKYGISKSQVSNIRRRANWR